MKVTQRTRPAQCVQQKHPAAWSLGQVSRNKRHSKMKKSHGFLLHWSSFGPEVFQVWFLLALCLHAAPSKRNQQEAA